MRLAAGKGKASIMPIYRRTCRFNMTLHLLILFTVHKYFIYSYITLIAVRESEILSHSIYGLDYKKRVTPGKPTKANSALISVILFCFSSIVFFTWLSILLLCSGDIHQNPGPSSTSSSDTTSCSSSAMSTTILALLIWSTICPLFITMFKVSFLN